MKTEIIFLHGKKPEKAGGVGEFVVVFCCVLFVFLVGFIVGWFLFFYPSSPPNSFQLCFTSGSDPGKLYWFVLEVSWSHGLSYDFPFMWIHPCFWLGKISFH